MKKLIALILSLCFLLPCVSLVVAAEAGYTLVLDGQGDPAELTGATTYTLPAPEVPAGKAFVGWRGTMGDQPLFLPAGAELTLTTDLTLSAVYVGIGMRSAPEIRYDIKGLRYITNIDRADLVALGELSAVGYGTLIVPEDYLSAGQSLNHAVLAEKKLVYLDIETEGAYAENETIVSIAGSIGRVKNKNFCRSFLAAGYLKVIYTDGSEGYVYAPVKKADAKAHLYALACEAYEGQTGEGLTFLERVLDAVINLDLTCDNKNVITNIAYGPAQVNGYQPAYTAKYEKNNERIVISVNEGEQLNLAADYAGIILDEMVFDLAFDRDAKNVEIGTDGSVLYIHWIAEYSDFY